MTARLPLVALAASTVASIGGTRLSAIAIPWLVLTTTNDPVLTGIVGFAEMLPYVLAKALGGPLIDRIGARRIAISCDCLSALAIIAIPLLFWTGQLSIWALLPAVALVGILRAPSDASKQALVPVVAALGTMPLERVTGIMGASDRLAGTLGAAGAGLLIALIGPVPALIANGVTFLASALILGLGLRQPNPETPQAPEPQKRAYFSDLAAGWTNFRSEPVLVALVLMIAFTNLFDQAYAMLLLPVWVRSSNLDVSWVGTLLAVFSAAAIVGAASAAAVATRVSRLLIYIIGFFFAGPVPMAALALGLPLPAIVGVLLLSGFAAGFLNPIIGAVLFERIPKPMVGRVIALVGALTWCLMPLGGLYGGVLVETLGITTALTITSGLYLLATMAPIAVPSFRQLNKRPMVPEQ